MREVIDQRLVDAYASVPAPDLSASFHARLELRLEAEAPRRRQRLRCRLLAVYWSVAFALSLWVLATLPVASEAAALSGTAFLTLLLVFAGPAILLGRALWPEVMIEALETIRPGR